MSSEPYILYIEDERSMIDLVQPALQLIGYKMIGVRTGKQGMALIRERKPDLVLLDLMMPNFNGWDVYRTMKQDDELAHVPIIIVTARAPESGQTVLADLPPADDYITKPFDVEDLLHSIEKLLNK